MNEHQTFFKIKPWRSKKYLAWVRQQPSIISEMPGSDVHHLKGHGFSGTVRADDWAVIPLTREEHSKLHTIGYGQWESIHGKQTDLLMKFWLKNFNEIKGFLNE